MKYTFALAALVAFTSAQSIADLPTCSLSCVVNGVTEIGCSATDFECSCTKADQLTPAITPCVLEACPSPADQAKVISTLEGICAAAGFPIDVPEPTSAAPSSAAPTSAEPEPTSDAPAPTETEAESSSAAPTIQTSEPAPTSAAVSSSAGYAIPSAPAESACSVATVTVTSHSPAAPYPTKPAGTGVPPVPKPSGTGVHSAPPPFYTGAASAMKVPAGVAGIIGLAAFVL
ncbi:hypothetical protein GRF29_8g1189696 [Pseudopithomyces chartarum]|uniref:CFEM domain-containing protein n=1 Tax=Pseudopithomyces chartarum TaxID=1892770 RepID=A0AAN6M3R6_9PLEO|nr:hypothetical protein GRF29_8g1189696 [Pseudopithomyces chartarum]